MNSAKANLAEALRERRAIIADDESRRDQAVHLSRLQAVSEKIVALQRALPQPVDPELAHFLVRCSYEKALAFLESQS